MSKEQSQKELARHSVSFLYDTPGGPGTLKKKEEEQEQEFRKEGKIK